MIFRGFRGRRVLARGSRMPGMTLPPKDVAVYDGEEKFEDEDVLG
jgi:hypothetical protein